ncbi:MFS polyamine transporter [Mycena albidolilacea]|uniref:MFS polyamine transporter n=1 Tax=Mycena albidolilacea TaxID=1033008 RepID=A0AAD6Z4H4_9AGAR|nr:MFS polyamine transporter [Mycena albidolilacea]
MAFEPKPRDSPPRPEDEKDSVSLHVRPSDIVVDWEGPDDPLNPKNWNRKKKWAATLIVAVFALLTPVASSMIAPASPQVAAQFGITSDVTVALITSIFILGYIVGPLFLGPFSEIFGRNRVIQGANLWFLVWNLACGFAQNTGQLLAFRLLAGLGGSAPLAIAGAVIGDIWAPEERGHALAMYSLAPLLGPVVGPLCGAFVAEKTTWRWVFWSTTLLTTVIQVLGVFYLRESYAPIILEKKANEIRRSLDSETGPVPNIRSKFATKERTWQRIMKIALTRPFAIFYHEPIVQLLGAYMAFVYGIFYLFVTSMPLIFQGTYGESVSVSGLHYIALGIGVTGASLMNAKFTDYIFKYLKDRNGGAREPEYRIPSMVPGTVAVPVGLFMTGWAVQARVHWIVADIGIALVGAGIVVTFQAMQIYVVDAFPLYAASALAAVSFLRSLCGFGFPLFAPSMYMKLGYGKGDTILAVLGIVIGCPAPWLFWTYGKQIRMKSKYVK